MSTNFKKPKAPEFTSPKGTFRFPSLSKPDFGTAEFPKPAGQYKVDLILSQSDSKALEAKLETAYQQAIADGQAAFEQLPKATRVKLKEISINPLYQLEYDRETEEETGNVIWKFKMTATGVRKDGSRWEAKPSNVDATLRPLLTPATAIYGGTVGRVRFAAVPYFVQATGTAGLSLRLIGTQVLDLVTAGGMRSGSAMGFEVEDGYVAADSADVSEEEDETGFGSAGDEAAADNGSAAKRDF